MRPADVLEQEMLKLQGLCTSYERTIQELATALNAIRYRSERNNTSDPEAGYYPVPLWIAKLVTKTLASASDDIDGALILSKDEVSDLKIGLETLEGGYWSEEQLQTYSDLCTKLSILQLGAVVQLEKPQLPSNLRCFTLIIADNAVQLIQNSSPTEAIEVSNQLNKDKLNSVNLSQSLEILPVQEIR
jgi:hypothetical protein